MDSNILGNKTSTGLRTAPVDLKREIYDNTLRTLLGPIRPFLEDPSITEVMLNGPHEIYVERAGRLELTNVRFKDEDALMAAAKNIAQYINRPLDPYHPTLDARLPDGSRVHVILPPLSRKSLAVCIRKFSNDRLSIESLIKGGSISPEGIAFLHASVNLGKNILVSGGTGTGKTSLLNVLTGCSTKGSASWSSRMPPSFSPASLTWSASRAAPRIDTAAGQ